MAYHQGRLVALVSHQSVRAVYHHTFRCVSKMLSQWWYTTVSTVDDIHGVAVMICNSLRNWLYTMLRIDFNTREPSLCFLIVLNRDSYQSYNWIPQSLRDSSLWQRSLDVPDYQPLLSKRGGPLAVERFIQCLHRSPFPVHSWRAMLVATRCRIKKRLLKYSNYRRDDYQSSAIYNQSNA